MHYRFALTSLILAIAACGSDPKPAPADAMVDTTAPRTTASPRGGVYRAMPSVTLTADEPATIYYTVDGSTPTTASASGASPVTVTNVGANLQFFAVDTTGNTETVHGELYAVDRLGPAPVTDFVAVAATTNVDLTWTNPTATGFTEVLIARVTDVAATVPATGPAPAVNATLGAGTIIFVGNAAAFTDVSPGPGHHTYAIWAHYDTQVFSEGRLGATRISEGPQACSITIDMAAGTTTINTQPTSYTLAAANTVVAGNQVTVDVTLTPQLAGVTGNPKLVATTLTSAPATTLTFASDATTGAALQYRDYGPTSLLSGTAVTRTLTFTAAAPAVITMDCTIEHSVVAYYGDWCAGAGDSNVIDLDTGFARGLVTDMPVRFGGTAGKTCTAWRGHTVSPDGRYIYMSSRTANQLVKVDATTLTVATGLTIAATQNMAALGSFVLDPSGRRIYAVLNDGGHAGANFRADLTRKPAAAPATVDVFLLEIDAATMTEVGRLPLGTGDWLRRGNRLGLSKDGRNIAVPIGAPYTTVSNKELRVIDVSQWTEKDLDPVTAGVQGVPVGALRPSVATWSETGRYLVYNNSFKVTAEQALVGIYDTMTNTVATADTSVGTTSANAKATVLIADGPDRVWVFGYYDAPGYITPSTGAFTLTTAEPFVSNSYIHAAGIAEDGLLYVFNNGQSNVDIRDRTTGALVRRIATGSRTFSHGFALGQ